MFCAARCFLACPQRLVVAAERRAAVAADEAGGVQAGLRVAQALQHRQPHQRLHAAHEGAAVVERVLVVERDGLERLADGFGQRGVHRDASPVAAAWASVAQWRFVRMSFLLMPAKGYLAQRSFADHAHSEKENARKSRASEREICLPAAAPATLSHESARRRALTATTSRSCASCSATRGCPMPNSRRASACRPRRPGGASSGSRSRATSPATAPRSTAASIGLGVLAFVRIDAERNTASATRELEDAIRALPEVIGVPLHQRRRHVRAAGGGDRPRCVLALRATSCSSCPT